MPKPGDGMNQGFDKNRLAIIIGGIFVFLGLWQLLRHFFGDFFNELWEVSGIIVGVLGSLVVIAVGILLVVAARSDRLNLPKNRKLYRSTTNRKIAGVCGGIAEYLNMNRATVRIVSLVLAVVSWYIVIPLYLLLWVILPPGKY
jgi:phage shock protein PspC (stress-responsive transcriptional regulator)